MALKKREQKKERIWTTERERILGAQPSRNIIHDDAEIRKLLDRAETQQAKVVVQFRSNAEKFTTTLESVSSKARRYRIRQLEGFEDKSEEQIAEYQSRLDGRDCLVLIFLKGQSMLGIDTQYESWDEKGMNFPIPKRVFKMQRRERKRYEIPRGYEYMIELNRPGEPPARVRKLLANLSSEGMGFNVPLQELDHYRPGTIIPGIRLSLHRREFYVDAEIRAVVPIDSRKIDYKVGLRFVHISAEDAEFLARFLFAQLIQLSST